MRQARHGVERTAARGGVSSLPSHGVGWGIEPAAAWRGVGHRTCGRMGQ